jgi:hypothetical protein
MGRFAIFTPRIAKVGLASEEEQWFFFLLLFLFVNPCGIVENSGVESPGFPVGRRGKTKGRRRRGYAPFERVE